MPKDDSTNKFLTALGDSNVPLALRSQQLLDVLIRAKDDGDTVCQNAIESVFQRLQHAAGNELADKRAKLLASILKQIETAPLRPATFLRLSQAQSGAKSALVMQENGETAYVVSHDPTMGAKLKLGDPVMLDAHAKIMVRPDTDQFSVGREARLERVVDEQHVEVINQHDERVVSLAKPELMKRIKSGAVQPGAMLILSNNDRLALRDLPTADTGLSHFRFLDKGPVPDVIVERDIGAPPAVIGQVARHVREEMTRPHLRRKFKLRPCITRLLCGVSGTGKTLARLAMQRQMYEIMAEVTGTPMEQLPPQVFVFRVSKMLSMWLGESDKNIDRMFDEVEQRAGETYVNAQGDKFTLPVMVVMEEADGMGRSRGSSSDSVYDRILTTLLQRLDPNREGLSGKLVVFLSTTNEPHIVDPAFLRRIGGTVEVFGRLGRDAFTQVLTKHLAGLPVDGNGDGHACLADKVSQHLFGDGDTGVVELTYAGHARPVKHYRRDFLTGALVDRSVQDAATQAWEAAISVCPDAAVSADHLLDAFHRQVDHVVGQLCVENVHSYLDLPEGVRVSAVKRL